MAYSEEEKKKIIDEACNRVLEGEKIRDILKDEHMPGTQAFFAWVDSNENQSKQYARALEVRSEIMAAEILEIADDSSNDTYEIEIGDGVKVTKTDNEVIQRSKLRVDTRKWLMSKMNAKKYGDRVQQDVNLKTEQPLFGDK